MLTPSSRLGDDLYRLYLACMAWLLLPFYGALFNEVLPSEWSQFDDAFDIAVMAMCLAGVWSGLRGGPLMVTRAVILHELGSPISKRRLLLPWLIRQAAAWSMAAAVIATVTIVLADQESFGYEVAFSTSAAAILAAWTAVFLAALAMVASHVRSQRIRTGAGVVAVVVVVIVAVATGLQMRSSGGIVVLAVVAVMSTLLACVALEYAPTQTLWRRATAVESMRSSMQQFQFQRVLVDLRNAAEQPVVSTGSRVAWPRLPLGLWRHVVAVQHTMVWHMVRLVVFTGSLAALFWWGDLEQGVVGLALAGCALLIGIELSGAIAATSDQLTFVVHYPKGSGPLLRSQVLTSVVIAAILGVCAVLSRVVDEPRAGAGVLIICVVGALSAAVQARLGSPDIAALLARFGPDVLSNLLWARALLGPLTLLATTVLVYHQFLRSEPLNNSLYGVIVALVVGAFVVSTSRLERRIEQPQG